MKVIREFILSKKFWMVIVGSVMQSLKTLLPDYGDIIDHVTYLIMAYIFGQGVADLGKTKVETK